MRKRQSHWPALTYYHLCFDFSKSFRANPYNVINIHEPSSSFILSAFYIVISGIIRSSFLINFFPLFFIETLNNNILSTTTSPKFSQHDKYEFILGYSNY